MRYNRSNLSYLISKKFNKNELDLVSELKTIGLKAVKKTNLTSIKSDLSGRIGKKNIKYFFFVNIKSFSNDDIRKFTNKLKENSINFEMILFKSESDHDIGSYNSDYIELVLPRDKSVSVQFVKKMIKSDLKMEVNKYLNEKFNDSKEKDEINSAFVRIMTEDLGLASIGVWKHKNIKSSIGKVYCDSYIGRQLVVPQKYFKVLKNKESEILKFYNWGDSYVIQFSSKDSFVFSSKEKLNDFEEEIIKESLLWVIDKTKTSIVLKELKDNNVVTLRKVNIESGLENLLYDFRDVINTIKTVSHMFRSDPKELNFFSNLKGILLTSCDDLLFLIIDLMSEKYQEHLNIKPHTVDNIFVYLEGKFKDVLDFYQINFQFKCDVESTIECDGIKLKRAIGYLVNSSRKILVYEGTEQPVISIIFKEKRGSFLFEVRNNGPHFSKKDRVNFFEKMSFNENQEHSGLGFMIAKKIVEEHNGTLQIKSGTDGTSFQMEIPKKLLAA